MLRNVSEFFFASEDKLLFQSKCYKNTSEQFKAKVNRHQQTFDTALAKLFWLVVFFSSQDKEIACSYWKNTGEQLH